jgi:hypothetical protein
MQLENCADKNKATLAGGFIFLSNLLKLIPTQYLQRTETTITP